MENALYIPTQTKQERQATEVTKVGGLNKAKRMVSIRNIREGLESSFLQLAAKENKKVVRAEAQRNDRRAKR